MSKVIYNNKATNSLCLYHHPAGTWSPRSLSFSLTNIIFTIVVWEFGLRRSYFLLTNLIIHNKTRQRAFRESLYCIEIQWHRLTGIFFPNNGRAFWRIDRMSRQYNCWTILDVNESICTARRVYTHKAFQVLQGRVGTIYNMEPRTFISVVRENIKNIATLFNIKTSV